MVKLKRLLPLLFKQKSLWTSPFNFTSWFHTTDSINLVVIFLQLPELDAVGRVFIDDLKRVSYFFLSDDLLPFVDGFY